MNLRVMEMVILIAGVGVIGTDEMNSNDKNEMK